MKKATKKIVNKYNEWLADNLIYTEWEDEDYENTTVYENVNGDVIVIQRDENGNIVYAWEWKINKKGAWQKPPFAWYNIITKERGK